jgi:hypothetical protein
MEIDYHTEAGMLEGVEVTYGKSKLTRQERLTRIRESSEMNLTYNYRDGVGEKRELMAVTIELHGKLAAIPSLKNSKPMGQNFMSKQARDYLAVVDNVFKMKQGFEITKQMPRIPPMTFGTEKVFVLVVFGKRSRSFDPDNGLATVKDWLESSEKMVGQRSKHRRGWGCGLVNNDSQVTAFGVHAEDLGLDTPVTTIYLRRLETMREFLVDMLARAIMEG